jgi:hypothetical protein
VIAVLHSACMGLCDILMKKQTLIGVLAALILIRCMFLYPVRSTVIAPVIVNASMSTLTLVSNSTAIDHITDDKGLGYTDSRKVARDTKGNLYVAYRNKYRMVNQLRYHIFVAKSTDNGATWVVLNGNRPIETTGDYNQRVPSIAIDSQDVIHVVWYGLDASHTSDNDRQIKYVRSADGGKRWQSWVNLAEVGGYKDENLWQEHPIIYADNQDRLYVVWEGRDPANVKGQIKLTSSVDSGKTWRSWINVALTQDTYFSRPTLVATRDGAGLYILAYAQFKNRHQIVWTQSNDNGATWAKWANVAPDEKDQRHVSLTVDRTDRLHAVWRQQPSGSAATATTQIFYAIYANGAWGAAQQISPNTPTYHFFPSITATDSDQIWVTWLETATASGYPKEEPTGGTVYYTVNVQGQWQAQRQLGNRNLGLYPSLSWNRQLNLAAPDVVWLEQAPTGGDQAYAIHAASSAIPAALAVKTK